MGSASQYLHRKHTFALLICLIPVWQLLHVFVPTCPTLFLNFATFNLYFVQQLEFLSEKTIFFPKSVIDFLRNPFRLCLSQAWNRFAVSSLWLCPLWGSLPGSCPFGYLSVMMLYPVGTDSAQPSITLRRGRGRWMDQCVEGLRPPPS